MRGCQSFTGKDYRGNEPVKTYQCKTLGNLNVKSSPHGQHKAWPAWFCLWLFVAIIMPRASSVNQ